MPRSRHGPVDGGAKVPAVKCLDSCYRTTLGESSSSLGLIGEAMADRLLPGEQLVPGQSLWSANSNCQFALQADGNVVLSREPDHIALLASGTYGNTPPTINER